MYKVEIHVQEKGSKEKKETFVIGDIDSSDYHDEMNAVSDYLYGLDIPFDVEASTWRMPIVRINTVSSTQPFMPAMKRSSVCLMSWWLRLPAAKYLTSM